MYPAVHPRVGDVVGNLPERCVVQDDGGHCRIRQGNRLPSFAVKTSHDLGRPVACTAVIGGITREAWGRDEWGPAGITLGFRVAIRVACMDGRFGTPEIVVIFVQE